MIIITFPDGTKNKFKNGITPLEIAQSIGQRLASDAVAAKVNDKLVDLSTKIEEDSKLQIITFDDAEGIETFRHSTAHILADAVTQLFPEAKPTIGPVVDEGFYYDFDAEPFNPDDLKKIEQRMHEIVKENKPFERIELDRKEAINIFRTNSYKLELVEEFGKDLSAYKSGKFIDLCRGPHVPSAGKIKAFKLTKIAGAYWRGDAKNRQLQRIYGISFPDKKQLKDYLTLLEEAERRDHRKLGKQMDLFSFHEEAAGMPFFHDKGSFIWNTLVQYTTELMKKRNYEINITPIILNKSLWLQSGHWDHYKDNMYFTKIDEKECAIKPMNCPGNILIYKTKAHSYRELPIKAGEFGLVHRHELSGVLSGLFRVRCFTQDDAHVFCTEEQVEAQVKELLDFAEELYGTFGFKYHIELSTKPEKAMGDPNLWALAEEKLQAVLDRSKVKYKINEGDGAFYGPKIDFHFRDVIGRTWQCGTIQLDFQMPEKFDLNYEGKDGRKHRPVMLHRAILGSVERFMGILIEHYAGKFPLWIAPVQAKIITVSDKFNDYAARVKEKLEKNDIRVEMDLRTESVSKKVRDAQVEKIPLIINMGEKEETNKTLAVRTLDGKVKFGLKLDDFVKNVKENVENKEEKIKF